MGRQKGDPNRSKSRPSSSSTAASLLLNSRTSAVGFGGYVGNSRIEVAGAQVKDHDTEVDGEASLHLRRLSKKDPITRVKALEALGILFKERPANELRQLIPNWIFEYKRLVQDDNQQVREGAHNVMSTLAVAVGREFAPHLRSVMGAWWVSQFDPSREVCGAAQQSFQVAFHGPQKRVEALMFCGSDILAYMDDLLKLSPQTISDKSTPIEEATKKYELVISSALLALAAFLDVILVQKSVSTSAIASVQDGDAIKKNDEKRNEFRDLAAKFCLNHKFFRDYAKSKSSQIRSASYQTLRAFAQNVPAVFNGSNLEIVGGIVLGSFSDKDPSCHAAMWDMVLLVSQKYPQTWDTVSVCKFVLPRLWAFLRHAAYGSAQTSYPCVLPLLRLIPTDTIKPAFGFLKELFVNLWKGHDGCHMGVKDELALLKAVQECFLWTISNAVRYTEKDDVLPEQIQYFMIENVLVKILWNNYAFAGMPLPDSISVGLSANHETGFNAISDVTSADHGSVKEKFTDQFIKHLRTCIIDLLAAIALKSTNLIGAFCTLFQDVCLQMVIYEGRYHLQSSSEGPGCISRISSFFSHLAELLSSNETHNQWLLNQAVRPLVAKLYPVVKSMEYKGSTQLIATIVSMFGPSSFLTLQVIQPAEREGGPDEVEKKIFEDEERLCLAISSFIRNELAPWCLDGNEASSTAKIELLLSIFDDTRFQGDWDLVLAYATNLEEVSNGVISLNIHKVSVLATLVEKLRFKIFGSHRGEEYHECDCQSNRQWNLLRLDGAALAVAGSLSLSHPSCIRLLRFLLGGSDMEFSPPILSKQTTEQVIRLLLQRTLHMLVNSENEWARYAASSVLLPDTVVQLVTAEDARVSTNLSCAAMEALCSSIFCVQNIHNSFEDAAKVVASFYCVYWDHSMRLEKESSGQGDVEGLNDTDDDQSESFMDNQFELDSGIGRLGDSSDKDVSLDVNGSQHDTEEMGANIKALQSILSSGFCKNLSAVMRVIIRQKLAQCIRYAIFDESTESFWMTSLCANWALALIDQLCVDMEETQELLDLLLKPAKSWPFFTAFSCSKADDSFKIVHNQMEHGIKERQHTRFCAFVDRVASVFGWGKVVFGPMWQNMQTNATESQRGNIEVRPVYRVWTLIELLCSWQWPGGKAINSVIPFLESCAVCASGSSEQIVVNCIVNSLFSAALTINYNLEFSNKSWMGLDEEIDDIEDACLRALLVLLKKLSRTDPPHGMIDNAKRFFDMLILDQGFLDDSLLLRSSNILPHILSILVPILRKRRHPSNESIPSNASNIKNGFSLELAVCKWMSLALSAPPLSLCGLSNSEVEHQVWVAVSCFPLHPRFGHIHHFLDDLSHWISKKVAEKVGPYLPEDFEILVWIPSHLHGRIHSVERAATIFVREGLLLAIFYLLFARVESFCRWLSWVYVSNARKGNRMTEDEYRSSSFCLMKDPLQLGLVLWEVTRLLYVFGPLFKVSFGLDAVGKVRSAGFIMIITWFLFRWKNLVLERLISQHKKDAPQLIAFNKVVSLAMYYLAGTCIGEVSGLAFRSVLAIGGISGIAVGLAAKEVIGNFLGGTLLFITRPFVIGDKVKAQSFAGEVEDIDFLHTKLVGFDKTPVLVPNQAILKEVIVNYSRAKCRQLDAEFQLRNEDVFLIDKITGQITEYLHNHPKVVVEKGTERPVCYLKAMGTHGLNIELLCFLKEKETVAFFKLKQEILVQAAHIITNAGASLETSIPLLNAPILLH